MKTIFFISFISLAALSATAKDTDSAKRANFRSYFSIGYEQSFLPFNALNKKLFGDDTYVYYGDDWSGVINFSSGYKNFFYVFQVAAGINENETDNNFSRYTSLDGSFYAGYDFKSEKVVSFTSRIGLGFTNFSLYSYPKSNSISFDSLLNQSNSKTGTVDRSVSLVSDYNFYIKPEIGIDIRPHHRYFKRICYEVLAGYQFYPLPMVWNTNGGQIINNVPISISGIPTLTVLVKFNRRVKRLRPD